MKGRDIIKELNPRGWLLDRVRGSRHVFKDPDHSGHVVVPHSKKELGKGFVAAIRKQAGL